MFSNFIWGILLVLLGSSLLVKSIFGIAIPIFRIVGGCILVYAGLCMITDISPKKLLKNEGTIRFEKKVINDVSSLKSENHFSVLFGEGIIDLSDLTNEMEPKKVKIDTVFGNTTLKINPNIPTKVTVKAGFGNVRLPEKEFTLNFGEYTYYTHDQAIKPKLTVKVDVAFGGFYMEDGKN